MLIYKNNPTLPQGGPDIGLKVGILAEIGNMLHECAVMSMLKQFIADFPGWRLDTTSTSPPRALVLPSTKRGHSGQSASGIGVS